MRADLIDHVFQYGTPGDVPIAGDWNGDGIYTIGVFRDGTWFLDIDGDGRWSEGDGRYDVRPGRRPARGRRLERRRHRRDSASTATARCSSTPTTTARSTRTTRCSHSARRGDKPVVGDWNGDGVDDPGTYHADASAAAGGTQASLPRRAG